MAPSQNSKYANRRAFGAALSGLVLADAPANAAVMPLQVAPGSAPFVVVVSEVGIAVSLYNMATPGPGLFYQYNNQFGKTLVAAGLDGVIASFPFGSPITTGLHFYLNFPFPASASGVRTVAFRSTGNQVGWIRMDLGGMGNSITYLAAAWNNAPGGSIVAGTLSETSVPEASSLALAGLAALATGVARHRRESSSR